ncbi:RNA-guided endonuclease TnpB family protein [Clostridium sp. CCUG 7971]|uniref:RNA-guided endonuclease TnpB family protein n=1 Tax=Clostridium sp. CCUG 7971 TaxID=2811414 RepID=UPI001ABADD07|nr:RNA-guided endonuclease TnpB family protein [Clostridium sp. CCUG 7971]MBO3444113.1 transposase [Clostridium sp. CCUG 7971]
MITTRKLKLTILGDEETRKLQYKLIRDEQYEQYKALNLCMSLLNTHNILSGYNTGAENKLNSQIDKLNKKLEKAQFEIKKNDIKQSKLDKLNSDIELYQNELNKLKEQFTQSSKYRSDIDLKFKEMYIDDLYTIVQNQVTFKNKDLMSLVTQRAKKDYSIALKNGMARGERSLTNYKRDFPLMTRGERWLKFKYDENSDDILIDWISGIKFKVILGYRKNENSIELRHTLHKVINKEYKICDSSIQFDRNNNLILNLTLDIPNNSKSEFIENRTLGVDLGIKYPAYICLSDDTFKRESIGCAEDFIRVREQIRNRRKRLQQQLKMVQGGKGREKKLKALDRISDKERNFVKTYNHMISKNIVNFAKKHKCQYINLEKLTKDGFPNMILSKWSYYELQQMIEYKAERENIKVRYIDPAYTSQTCSRCSHIEKDNRETQEKFKCLKCEFELNADHNAAINISRSVNFK